ncbi:MAG: phosphate ABC transporter, permease protein PstA, partial [Lactobacillaceae bacterium]
MNPKVADKIATTVLYIVSGIIIIILASLLGYILFVGLPHISWHFLSSQALCFEAGGGIGIHLFNSFF